MWNKKVKWFEESYKWIFLGMAIIGGPLIQITNSISNKVDLSPILHAIIIYGILTFQIIGLVIACITIHKYDKFRKKNSKKSIF